MIWLLLACAPTALELQAEPSELGVDVVSNLPMDRVEIHDAEGQPLAIRRLPSAGRLAHVTVPLESGATYTAVGVAGLQRTEALFAIPTTGPVTVQVEAPAGQGRQPLNPGDVVPLVRMEGASARVALHLEAGPAVEAEVRLGEHLLSRSLGAGERTVIELPVNADGDAPIEVRTDSDVLQATLRTSARSIEAAREALTVSHPVFPVDAWGRPDRARPPDRVTLPSRGWETLMTRLGLGWRPRSDQAPWAWQALTLRNHDDEPLSVLIRAQVLRDGEPAPAFRAQIREGESDEVRALLRVPAAGEARAILPLHVDRHAAGPGDYTRVLEVFPLGSDRPVHRIEAPLRVSVGSGWASGGLAVALTASVLGYGLLALRGRRWMAERRTSELVTIALFGSLTFVVGAAFQILGMGVATVLGPFAPLLTGLPDDAFRACLLGALVTLIPRPGVVALATATGFLMRGLALGSFHPVDLLYLGSSIFWLESCLWLAGCTRDPAWTDGSRGARWLRLGLGLGVANVCATASALVVSVVFYRLFFAGWYVALILALPGFLYVLAGALVAVDFAAALRRVAP